MKKNWLIIGMVLFFILIIVITNMITFEKSYLIGNTKKISIPLFSFYSKISDNKVTFYSLKSKKNTKNFNSYIENNKSCYDEGYFYVEKDDVTIMRTSIEDKFLFNKISVEYYIGNYCENEFVLDENWSQDFLNNADIYEIKMNEKDLDIEIIKNRIRTFIDNNIREENKNIISINDYKDIINIYYNLNNKSYHLSILKYNGYIAFVIVDPDDHQKNAIYKTDNIDKFFKNL
jgi:hypothetical protein